MSYAAASSAASSGAPSLTASFDPFSPQSEKEIAAIVNAHLGRYPGGKASLEELDWRTYFGTEEHLWAFVKRWNRLIGCDGHHIWLRARAENEKNSNSHGPSSPSSPSSGQSGQNVQSNEAVKPWRRRMSETPSQATTAGPPPVRKMSDGALPMPSRGPPASPPSSGHGRESNRERYLGYKLQRVEAKLEKASKGLAKFRTLYQALVHQLTCSICMEAWPRLFESRCCAALACERCAGRAPPCPTCQASEAAWTFSPALSRLVSALRLDCPLGCGEDVTVAELERHKGSVCQSALVSCPHAQCQVKVRRRHQSRHKAECPYTRALCDPQRCQVCAERVAQGRVADEEATEEDKGKDEANRPPELERCLVM